MQLTEQDRVDITDLINLHGHLVDAGDLDRLHELFTADIVYDARDYGAGELVGAAAIREAALALGPGNPVGHHVTNIVITGVDGGSARVRSKGLGITAGGTTGSLTYDDIVTRRPEGWRISRRTLTARRVPLGGRDGGPHDVLDRFRDAAIGRSAEGMRAVYAPDAVMEFPFAFPGVPSRFEGRDAIVDWVSALWESSPLQVTAFRTLAVHSTTAPDTIIVEQEALTTGGVQGDAALPNVLVLTARAGQIVHLRDYVNVVASAAVLGVDLGSAATR
jgi:ketosteroid isomerase-like protein